MISGPGDFEEALRQLPDEQRVGVEAFLRGMSQPVKPMAANAGSNLLNGLCHLHAEAREAALLMREGVALPDGRDVLPRSPLVENIEWIEDTALRVARWLTDTLLPQTHPDDLPRSANPMGALAEDPFAAYRCPVCQTTFNDEALVARHVAEEHTPAPQP